MKRFTETLKWQDGWFSELQPAHKLAWIYLCDACDNAGVIDPPGRVASFMIGMEIDWEQFLEAAKDRITILDCGKWWLSKFIEYQYKGGVSATSKQHEPIRRSIDRHSIPIQYLMDGCSTPKGNPSNGSQEKEKVKVKEKAKEPETVAAKVCALKDEWNRPAMTGGELEKLEDCRDALESLSDDDWNLLAKYLSARLPKGAAYWQPHTRGKFLETVPDVLANAFRWAKKKRVGPNGKTKAAFIGDFLK